MLIIEVTNARDVVRKRIGLIGEKLFGKVVDAESKVEKALIHEMETAFQEFGIEARIFSVSGPHIEEGNCLKFPIQVKEERDVKLND